MDLLLALQVFVLVLPAELPDKTFVATVVLATRYPGWAVWAGVVAAFAVQTAVAVTAGGLVSLLPRAPVLAVVAVLFAVGAVVMLRGGEGHEDDPDGASDAGRGAGSAAAASGPRAVATSFAVLFTAEWGDLSQLLTAGLAARYGDPLSVFTGAWAALATVAGLAVLVGGALARRVPLPVIRRVAGGLFAVLAVVTAYEAVAATLRG